MAHIRTDSGSIRFVYETLCHRLGHGKVAEITGKSVWTVRAYCNPRHDRKVPDADIKKLDRYMWLEHGERPFFDALNGCPHEERRACG